MLRDRKKPTNVAKCGLYVFADSMHFCRQELTEDCIAPTSLFRYSLLESLYPYAFALCFGINWKPSGTGPSSSSEILTQSTAWSLAINVSRSLRP